MPSFPTSVFAPTNKSAGQNIQHTHVNDVQDEIVAIEGGYLNGTARLNSSGSTLASLDVNGNSTLASSITLGAIPYVMPSSGGSTGQLLTCVSTSGSTMTLEWRAPASTPPDAVRVELSAALELADGSSVGVSWVVDQIITNSSMHSTGTNPDRISPQSTGLYWCHAELRYRNSNSTAFQIGQTFIKDSSGANIAVGFWRIEQGNQTGHASGLKRFDTLSATPYVRVAAKVNASTNSIDPTGGLTHFTMVKL